MFFGSRPSQACKHEIVRVGVWGGKVTGPFGIHLVFAMLVGMCGSCACSCAHVSGG